MTNSSPQPPLPPRPDGDPQERQRRKAVITFDEAIAIIVAFTTIGAILFWSLARGKTGFSPAGWLSSAVEGENTTAAIDPDLKASRVLSARTEADTLELTEKYLGAESELETVETLDNAVIIPTKTRRKSNNIITTAAPVATGLILAAPKTATPEVVETPVTEPETPEVAETPVTEPEEVEAPPAATEPETPEVAFEDVPESYWAYPFIEKLEAEQLVIPSSTNRFEPDKLVTRAGMATLISQAFDLPETQRIKKFGDVSNKNAIASDIDKAVKKGFMKGYSDTEFRPIDNIPRYQVLVTLATGLGLKPSQDPDAILSQFKDGDKMPDWAKEQVAAAAETGLIVNPPGVSSNSLNPDTKATRAEAAAMIHQALVKLDKLKSIDSQYIVNP